LGGVNDHGRAKALGYLQTIFIEIDHNDLGWRVELSGQQFRQSDWPGSDNGNRAPRLDFTQSG
jgi:hypothetical protein